MANDTSAKKEAVTGSAEFIPPSPEQLREAFIELESLLGRRATTAEAVREHHSHGESYHPAALPDIVCFPQSTEEVSKILKITAKHNVPVIPFGGGTSMEAQVNAIYGGTTIDMREMNKILQISTEDLQVTVEAGVTRLQVIRALANTGFTFFIDPGADATIGGMTSTRASGTTAVRYGTMRENVLALTVVLADGRIIKTGTRARKSAAGYDLTRLFVGAEGTLGVITEITLRHIRCRRLSRRPVVRLKAFETQSKPPLKPSNSASPSLELNSWMKPKSMPAIATRKRIIRRPDPLLRIPRRHGSQRHRPSRDREEVGGRTSR